jgi:hypothetical protein
MNGLMVIGMKANGATPCDMDRVMTHLLMEMTLLVSMSTGNHKVKALISGQTKTYFKVNFMSV